jgi:hypothetical protein
MTGERETAPELREFKAHWVVRDMTDTELERHIEHCKRLLCRRELDTFARKARQAIERQGRTA